MCRAFKPITQLQLPLYCFGNGLHCRSGVIPDISTEAHKKLFGKLKKKLPYVLGEKLLTMDSYFCEEDISPNEVNKVCNSLCACFYQCQMTGL